MVEELKIPLETALKIKHDGNYLRHHEKKNQLRQDHKIYSPRIIIYHRRYLKVVSSITNMTQNGMKECFLFF